MRGSDVLLILVAILFPPAAAAMVTGCSCDLLINILLTFLGILPGHLHSFWLIYKQMKAEELYGQGGYVYIGSGEYEPAGDLPQAVAPQANYGSTNRG